MSASANSRPPKGERSRRLQRAVEFGAVGAVVGTGRLPGQSAEGRKTLASPASTGIESAGFKVERMGM